MDRSERDYRSLQVQKIRVPDGFADREALEILVKTTSEVWKVPVPPPCISLQTCPLEALGLFLLPLRCGLGNSSFNRDK
jgi:hypothetical protein